MEEYSSERAGVMVRNLSGEMTYLSFRPAPLPPNPPLKIDSDTIRLLVQANSLLARLDGISSQITGVDLIALMYIRKEALLSSQIEGTQCTLDDVLDPGAEESANLDVAEVVSYVRALRFGLDRLNTLPLSKRFLREVHAELLANSRGMEKSPGEFRHSQNWIGGANCSLKDARYIPPNMSDMESAMDDLERYMNSEDRLDTLIRTALVHYQFETIHPFLDGNGRIGRILVLFCLIASGKLARPVLSVSYFLKRNQTEYYDRLADVRRRGSFEQWVKFFLEALADAAEDAIDTIAKLVALHEKNISRIPKSIRKNNMSRILFNYLEEHPIIDIGKTARELGVSYNTISGAIRKLEKAGILKKTTNAARCRLYSYEEYIALLRP